MCTRPVVDETNMTEQSPDFNPVEKPAEMPLSAKNQPPAPSWLDLAYYLLGGLGLMLVASLGLSLVKLEVTLLLSVLVYSITAGSLLLTVYLFGVRRKRLDLAAIGLYPPRWNNRWALVALGLTVGLIPARLLAGLAAQAAFGRGLEELQARMDVFMPGAFTPLEFSVTLLFAGLVVPVAEEMFFRGAIFGWFRARFSFHAAVFWSSVIFALGHFDSVAVVVASFIMGVVNAIFYERTRSIWAPIAVHVINNSLAVTALYLGMLLADQLPL